MVGCKGLQLPTNPCTNCQDYTTLQGTIMNAITGERIGGTDMEIYLIQGGTVRTPTTFNTGEKLGGFFNRRDNSTTTLMGEYSFTDIPSETTFYKDADKLPLPGEDPDQENTREYKIVVSKPGFQEFNGIIEFDDEANVVGNIYLFPIGFLAPDYTFTVVYNGKPVPNATVAFEPFAEDNYIVTPTDHVIDPVSGYLPALKATTNAAGQVTFAGSKLALGASYEVKVAPVVFEGVQLSYQFWATIRIGQDDVSQIIELSDMCDTTGNNYCLQVVSISNSVDDQVDASGTLTIKFNRAVTLGVRPAPVAPATAGFGATLAVLPSAAVWPAAPASEVNASLSSDGLTLTLTPAWTTPPALTTELGQAITYTDNLGFLSVKGYPDSNILLSTLHDVDGAVISSAVQLSTP